SGPPETAQTTAAPGGGNRQRFSRSLTTGSWPSASRRTTSSWPAASWPAVPWPGGWREPATSEPLAAGGEGPLAGEGDQLGHALDAEPPGDPGQAGVDIAAADPEPLGGTLDRGRVAHRGRQGALLRRAGPCPGR